VFTDRRYFDSIEVADEVKADTRKLTLAFLENLHARPRAIARWADPRQGLIAKFEVRL
jgi:hypothetical protein